MVRMRPDLMWSVHGTPAGVMDAKYKQDSRNVDLYQMLAYCTALGLSRGHLVYAEGNAEPARHVVLRVGVEIVCHALDLTLPPERLLGQIAELASQLAAR